VSHVLLDAYIKHETLIEGSLKRSLHSHMIHIYEPPITLSQWTHKQ